MTKADELNELQPDGWDEGDWEGLLYAIKFKQCTPFLGAGACAGVLPLGGEIAREWADASRGNWVLRTIPSRLTTAVTAVFVDSWNSVNSTMFSSSSTS